MMKTLIIGANGFTGRRILQSLSRQGIYELTGCSLHEDILPGNNYRFVQADMNNHPAIDRLIAEIRPDVVINGSALSVPDYCESHHEEAYATNVLAVENIARCCEKAGSRFIHLSTDFVFDGKKAELYTETDTPAPVNYYGISKYQGEQAVAANCSNYANVRVVVVYGKALPGQHGNILQLVKNRLQAGQEIRVVSDQYRTPTWVQDIADGVEKLMHISQNGIWHICGDECLSIADIAYRVADYFKLDRSLIVPVTTEEMNEATPRPRFSGLSIEKAKRILGYAPHSLEEGMAEMK
ncbi:dTDP-4-dehydrorhamnose reductase [Parabacteroides faecis]|uniref:dTDP-4-dehydrorhamnose reductase n=1 Tax=Parabacteroides TaxID=375288 RepID=UPI0016561CD7|nr:MULTISPECIES: dTDP-4-dehydrorhamnose reductase [Parabacteroides]MBC8619812.1 dTDP-4-dehydrorhamnose reductase [Parabacteroides faecis]